MLPTFREWFNGRYWEEWVVARKNKPSTIEGKRSVFKNYLDDFFGSMRLDEIKVGEVNRFRAGLLKNGMEEKTVNNVLTVLSNPWRLMSWMGHKLINETHRYVHVAEAHMRELPPAIQAEERIEMNADRRILKMLSVRVLTPPGFGVLEEQTDNGRGNHVTTEPEKEKPSAENRGLSMV